MTKTFKIDGMTCTGCQNGVQRELSAISGVLSVQVHLETGEAILSTSRSIAIEEIQQALPEKYKVSLGGDESLHNAFAKTALETVNEIKISKLRQLRPLILIFIYIINASILLHIKQWEWEEVMLDFMGLFYIVFSFFKFLDLKGFEASFKMYDPLAKSIPIYGWVYPFIELGLGLLFLLRYQIPFALILTIIVLGITTIGVIRVLMTKNQIQCACLGTALKLPMTEATFIENAVMLCMAIFMLV